MICVSEYYCLNSVDDTTLNNVIVSIIDIDVEEQAIYFYVHTKKYAHNSRHRKCCTSDFLLEADKLIYSELIDEYDELQSMLEQQTP